MLERGGDLLNAAALLEAVHDARNVSLGVGHCLTQTLQERIQQLKQQQ